MANITTTIVQAKVPHDFESPIETRAYFWDPVGGRGTNGTATTAIATHNIIAIPEGYAFLQGWFVITEEFDSADDNATVQWLTGEANFTGALAEAALTVGEVIHLQQNLAITSTVGAPYYVDGTVITAETLDVAIATSVLTAGQGYFYIQLVRTGGAQTPTI